VTLEGERGVDRDRRGQAPFEDPGRGDLAERHRCRVEERDQPAAVDDARPARERHRGVEAAAAVRSQVGGGGERGGDRGPWVNVLRHRVPATSPLAARSRRR